ncbi:GNAT family N-acetyltransferase, partial [[Eubacterium] siraeum]|nr:GNAT family N-acetyltransferase [[Eubacterium] siraeum]
DNANALFTAVSRLNKKLDDNKADVTITYERGKGYVEPLFQNQGIGAVLLGYAINNFAVNELWVLEFNKRGIDFYRRNGFSLTGEKITEDEFVPLLKMKR